MARKKDIRVKLETEYEGTGAKKLEEGIDTLNEKLDELGDTTEKAKEKTEQLGKSFKKTGKEATQAGNVEVSQLVGAFSKLSKAIKGLMALQVVKWFYNLGKATVNAASDMVELQNVTDQVFEEMSESVNKYAVEVGIAMGRSTYQMKKYASDMGAVLKGLGAFDTAQIKKMSEELASLAVDIGSFKNVTDEEAFNAIRSGIVGETERLKMLGIVINDVTMKEYARNKGIKTAWENLDAATKAQLRYEAILEKTSFMQGDAARTINTYANQVKVLEANLKNIAASMGAKFTDNLAKGLQTFNGVLSAYNDLLNRKNATDFASQYGQELIEIKKLVQEYKLLSEQTTKTSEDRKRMQQIIETLKQKYPEELSNVDALKASYEDLSTAIDKVVASLKDKIATQAQEYYNNKLIKVQQDTMSKFERHFENIAELKKKALTKLKVNLDDLIDKEALSKLDFGKLMSNFKSKVKGKGLQLSEMTELQALVTEIYNESEKIQKAKIKANEKAEAIIEEAKAGQIELASLTKSMATFGDTMAKGFAEGKKALDDQDKKNDEALARTQGKLITKINDTAKGTTDTILGNNANLTSAEILEIMKNRGVITQFVKGALVKYQGNEDGTITKIERPNKEGYTVNNRGQYVSNIKKTVIKKDDFLKEFTKGLNLKPEYKPPKDKPLNADGKGSTKEIKDKYEQLIANLTTLSNELNTTATEAQKTKILSLTANIRQKQIDNIKALQSIGAIKLSESIQGQIKAIEQELEKAKELKDKDTILKLKDKINTLLVENILASAVDEVIKELENKTNISNSKTLSIDEGQKAKVFEAIAKFKDSNAVLETQLQDGLITQEEYLKQKLENSNTVIKAYQTIGELDKAFIEKLNQQVITLNQIKLNHEQNKMLNILDNILQGGDVKKEAELLRKSTEEYYQALNKHLQDLVKQLSTQKGWDLEKFKKVYSATDEQLTKMIEIAKSEGDKATEEIAKLMQTIKQVAKERNKADFGKKFIDTSSDVIKGLQSLNGALGGALDGVINFANNIQSIGSNISSLVTNGFSFGAVGGLIGGVIGILSGFLGALFHKDEGAIKAKREYAKDKAKWDDELPKSITQLRESQDRLASEMKNFTKMLIKNIAGNTSNSNILKNQNIATELAKEYANSFDAIVKSTISRTKHSYRWWGLSKDTQYLGTETKEESLRKILGIPHFETADDIRRWYISNKNKSYNPEFEKLGSGSSGLFGFKGYSHEEKLVGTNFREALDIIPVFADNVEKIMRFSSQTAKYGIYESLDGINVTSSGELKDQLRGMLKKLVESSGQSWGTVASKIEARLNELVKEDEVIVQAFDDVRGQIANNLAQGHEVIDSMANSLQAYFNKLRNNVSKIMYDLQFRDKDNFEKAFIDKFKKISDELVKLRLENGKTIKDLSKGALDFSNLFKQLKDMDKITNDTREIVTEIRRQAKAQGLSEDIIDKMLPLDKTTEKVKFISDMLKNGMIAALNTNSFDQFSMSIGDSLYKHVKEAMVQAFVDSNKFQELFKKYTDSDEYNRQIAEAKTYKEAYDIMQRNLLKVENQLKAEGLGFRETNTSNGEYLGGVTSHYKQEIARNGLIQSTGATVTVNNYIDNKGFLSTTDLTNSMAEIIKDKLNTTKQREV